MKFSFLHSEGITVILSTIFLLSCGTGTNNQTGEADSATVKDSGKVSARPVHWSYEEGGGPTAWATLSPVYALCGEGKNQSPINIEKSGVTAGVKWGFDYKPTSLRIAHNEHMDDIIDNGHTIQVTVDEGSTFTFADKSYALKQFHFHTPSEHTVDGKHMPMEMHMVHQSDDGALAVVGIFFKEGKSNANFAKIVANLPDTKGENKHLANDSIDIKVHMPADNYAYHYQGSLTTPPCSESVQWLVLRDMISLSPEQINAFSSRIGPNNRPTQALNTRSVQLDDLKTTETNK